MREGEQIRALAYLIVRLSSDLDHEVLTPRNHLISLVGTCIFLLNQEANLGDDAHRELLNDALGPARDFLEVTHPEFGAMDEGEGDEEEGN